VQDRKTQIMSVVMIMPEGNLGSGCVSGNRGVYPMMMGPIGERYSAELLTCALVEGNG